MFTIFLLTQLLWAQPLKVGIALDRPPYAFLDEQKNPVGVEIDILKKCIPDHELKIIPLTNLRAEKELVNKQLDVVSTSIKDLTDFYYTDSLTRYENVAVTKKGSGIVIKNLSDLKGYRVAAWQSASKTMGPEFKALFHPPGRPDVKSYYENSDQLASHLMFWKSRVDVLISDIYIFKWFKRKHTGPQFAVVIHPLHLEKHGYAVFVNKDLRDQCNKEIKKIRASGEDKKFMYSYIPPE